MNVRQDTITAIDNMIKNEIRKCENKIHDNKNKMKNLVHEQTVLKREKVMLYSLLNKLYRGEKEIK